jgi:hypothetical protein
MILTAEGQRESAIRSAEGQKQSQILTAEGAKQAAILNAEADRQSQILRARGERAARYLEAQGEAKAIEKVFAAIKAGRPTPELLAYQYLQTLPQMAQGEANKVWLVPSDFGKALEGFTRMLGAPGEDGVFRFQPSPVDDTASLGRPEDDDESIEDWFDTASDPEIAKVVADAEAQARKEVPPIGAPVPDTPVPDTSAALDTGPSAGPPPGRPSPRRVPPPPALEGHGPGYAPAAPREGRPQPATPPPAPPRRPESAVPTPPRGIPQVPDDRSGRGNGGPRPGYPSPPPQQ